MSATSNFLIFRLGEQFFAFNVSYVREVIEYTQITPIPLAPKFIEGIINLRGNAIPIIDLKKKFELGSTSVTLNTSIVILEIVINNEMATIGAIVDDVKDVVEIDNKSIELPPSIGIKIHPRYIEGIYKYNNDFAIIVNIKKVFSLEELDGIANIEPEK